MNFDSTTYLNFYLKEKLGLMDPYIEYCIRVLNGFVINPGSIKSVDKDVLTINGYLPNSDFKVFNISINSAKRMILISLCYKDMYINFACGLGLPWMRYSILVDNKENECNGIYYYQSSLFKEESGKFHPLETFYDKQTLEKLKSIFLEDIINFAELDITSLTNLIGNTPDTIQKLGFSADVSKWGEDTDYKKTLPHSDLYDEINAQLTSFDYNEILKKISEFIKEEKPSVEAVAIKKYNKK